MKLNLVRPLVLAALLPLSSLALNAAGKDSAQQKNTTQKTDISYGVEQAPRDAVNVPLDSWVYPALKRLAAMGYINSQFTGLMPWTRTECLRQTLEAQTSVLKKAVPDQKTQQLISALLEELRPQPGMGKSVEVTSLYARSSTISGTPLRDSYHFGDTIWNDFGRPYDEGENLIAGASATAHAGPFFLKFQGEYQHAPGRGPFTFAQRDLISNLDNNPVQPALAIADINRLHLLDTYAGVQMGDYSLSFGKQSLWLGPGESGPLMLSNNADPMYMLRFTRSTPMVLPGILHYLGAVNGEFLFGELEHHEFPARPFFNLQKISFHPTANLEVGFTRASLWAGVGHPFTAGSLWRNFTSVSSNLGPLSSGLGPLDDRNDPGDRKAGFDVSYRVPKLRNWLTLYVDSYSDDDPSPLANPRRAAINPGLYLSHLPGVSRLDFRFEAVSTQSLTSVDRSGQFLYFNNQYHDANTNSGVLFGNQTGRDGRSYQGWTTYHFAPQTWLQLSYRDVKASSGFLPGGGTQNDASAAFVWQLRKALSVQASVNGERWLIPSLKPGTEHNVTGSIGLEYTPHWRVAP